MATWIIVIFRVQEHNIVLTVLCSMSIVMQTYQLSLDSRHVLFASRSTQATCSISGITTLENFESPSNTFQSCDIGKFVPFFPEPTYALVLQQETKLIFSTSNGTTALGALDLLKPPLRPATVQMQVASCEELGVLCYVWKIQIPQFGPRYFEPCWHIVKNIYTVNTSRLIMYQNTAGTPRPYTLDLALNTSKGVDSIFFTSNVEIPLKLIPTHRSAVMEVDKLLSPPDFATVFVLIPAQEMRDSSMRLALSLNCNAKTLHRYKSRHKRGNVISPSIHTGIVAISAVTQPAFFTLHAAFSDCSSDSCNSSVVVSLAVYIVNIILCGLCLLITHCDVKNVNVHSGIYIFSLTTSVVTLNWVASVSIITVYIIQGKEWRRSLYALHTVQLVFIIRELVCNQLGYNPTYILSRNYDQHDAFLTIIVGIFLPFTVFDRNIYLQNCALYVVMSMYVIFLYFYNPATVFALLTRMHIAYAEYRAGRKVLKGGGVQS